MKKEIHLRLIKRIVTLSVLALFLCVGGTLYLELRQLDQTLLTYCQKESEFFKSLYISAMEDPDENSLAKLKDSVDYGIERTSFIQIELLDEKKASIVTITAPGTEAARQKFADSGRTLIPSDHADGVRLISNKRVYFKVILPILTNQHMLVGYISGLYQVSLNDTRKIISRFILTSGIVAATVLVCSLLFYFGFLLLNNRIIRAAGNLSKTNIFLLKKLGTALAKSDTMDPAHNFRVVYYAIKLAEQAGLNREEMRGLINGSFLHDLEMLPIPSTVLLKADDLSEEEFAEVKKHPKSGYASIKKMSWLRNGGEIIRHHHEKYDGSGYPAGIKHEKIPLMARVFSIADAFDALTSERPYRDASQLDDALEALEQDSGIHFDPVLLSSFVQIAPHLYQRISALDSLELEKELDRTLKKYITF